MRIAFAGTPAFAVPSLKGLLESAHEVVCVITQPDRPAGRGLALKAPPVKEFAEKHGLKVYQPAKFNKREFLDELDGLGLDLILTVAYGRIFRARSLALPARGCVNLHASLLPRYRGVAPINRAVIEGEAETGVTTFFMNEDVDAGEIILQRKTTIGENETAGELAGRLAELGAGVVVETCDLIARGEAPRVAQDESQASYAPKLSREDAEIEWDRPARRVHDRIRGVNPRPGAFARFREGTIKILSSRLGPAAAAAAPPGTILDIDEEKGILIACSEGSVWLREVQAAGRRPAAGAAFSRGARLRRGERLG